MDLLQLRYFCEIAKQESVSKAASILHVSQPSLSKSLSTLERDLGIKLFDRIGKSIVLNYHGKLVYEEMSQALNLITNLQLKLQDTDIAYGDIKLLILAATKIMPNLLLDFYMKYPNINIHVKQATTFNLQQACDYDFVISATPGKYNHLDNVLLLDEDIVLAVNKDHHLANKKSISLSETADESFITYSVGPSIRTLTDNLCLQAGFAPNILLECETPSNYRNFIQSGLAVCLLPYQTQYSLFSSDLIPIHLNDPVCKRKLFLSHPKGKYLNTAMVIFQKFCLEYFKKLN